MKICKMVVIPIAGAMLSAAYVSAQDNQPQPGQTKPAQNQSGQNQPGQAQSGQRPAGQTQPGQRQQTADHSGWQNSDQAMAASVAIDNQAEIAISKMAGEKLQNEEVKQFASMMVEQHQAYLKKLQKYAPDAAGEELQEGSTPTPENQGQAASSRTSRQKVDQAKATRDDAPGVRPASGTQADRTAGQTDAQGGSGADFVQIQKEIAQECLRSAKAEFQEKQGVEADQCFLGHQIAIHGAMKAKLTVLQRHASGELSQVFAEGAETAEKHKKEAEKLMSQVDNSDSGSEKRLERRDGRVERREERRQTDKE